MITFYGKILIKGKIHLNTGIHIGGTSSGLEVGGLDSLVIRDPISEEPIIPGSTTKGKCRAISEKIYDKDFNKESGKEIYRHECSDTDCVVCRVFGSSGDKKGSNIPSRIIFRDAYLTEESREELKNIDTGLLYTEWKTENSLDRITAAANPRQIERVPAGSEFNFEIVYTIENLEHLDEDLNNILAAMAVLEDDYLGGGGSRGSGNIEFRIENIELFKKEFYLEGDKEKIIKENYEGKTAKVLKGELNSFDFAEKLI